MWPYFLIFIIDHLFSNINKKKKLSGFFRAETFKGSVNLDISISETNGENLTFINHHENKSQTHVYNTLHLKYIL